MPARTADSVGRASIAASASPIPLLAGAERAPVVHGAGKLIVAEADGGNGLRGSGPPPPPSSPGGSPMQLQWQRQADRRTRAWVLVDHDLGAVDEPDGAGDRPSPSEPEVHGQIFEVAAKPAKRAELG